MNDVLMIMNRCHNDDSMCPLFGGVDARAETWIGFTPLPVFNTRLHCLFENPRNFEALADWVSTILQYYFLSQVKNEGSMKNVQML
jgi:hypothetical protein